MSFRTRLSLIFGIIVVLPMVAVALVLFALVSESQTGEADARVAEGLQAALALYDDDVRAAGDELRVVVADRDLRAGLRAGEVARLRRRARVLMRERGSIEAIAVYDRSGREIAQVGSRLAIAHALGAPTGAGPRPGTVAVSTTTAEGYLERVRRLTRLDVRVVRGDIQLATTLDASESSAARPQDISTDGRDYRGRVHVVRDAVGPSTRIGLFVPTDALSDEIFDSRVRVAAILLAFALLSLGFSILVVRALQRQIERFLSAAKRLGRGDFSEPIAIEGSDEFADLGREFNRMSEQLALKIEEVERKRTELEGTIRRVGEAFAAGLDRQGVIDLALRTALDACSAQAAHALPIDGRIMQAARVGVREPAIAAAQEAAERAAAAIGAGLGEELLARLDGGEGLDLAEPSRPTPASLDGAHALAVPLRARLGPTADVQVVGMVSIARRGAAFSPDEVELFAYLAGQVSISIENVDLHATVQLQALTDELTGLHNLRHFHERLDMEIERGARYGTDVALVMLDIDHFKSVNDTWGHQQGDAVLLEVARTIRTLSRDIDQPARYGGEEIAVVLPQTDLAGAMLLAERMRAGVDALSVRRLDGEGVVRVTASFGVAALPETASDKVSLIAAADAGLYCAKRLGRNRVEPGELTSGLAGAKPTRGSEPTTPR